MKSYMEQLRKHAILNSIFLAISIISSLFAGISPTQAATTIGLSPLAGPSGSNVVVTGSGLVPGNTGYIWFDADGNGVRDGSESFASGSVDGAGYITGSVLVPGVSPGYYMIRVDAPADGIVDAEALYHVQEPSLVLGITSGRPGQPIIISGKYFAPGKTGLVWFDTNTNYVRDATEPAMQVTSNASGEFYASINIPPVPAGAYVVRADLPSGDQAEGEAVFTALPALSITPSSGKNGTVITVNGNGFQPGKPGVAWLDTNKNGAFEDSETSTPVISDSQGRVIAAIPVPNSNISPGTYPVRVELPIGTAVKPSVNFILSNAIIALTTRKAVPGGTLIAFGSSFTPNSAGTLWFDSNDNGVQDADETSRDLITDKYGKFTANVVVPNAVAGVHAIRAVFQGSEANSGIAKINILTPPDLSLSVTNSEPGATIIITGAYFNAWSSGKVWLDVNGNGAWDASEVQKVVKTDGFGKFRIPLTIPLKSKMGAAAFYADIPGLGRPEAVSYFYINNIKASNRTSSGPTESGGTLDVISSRPNDDAKNVKRMPIITVTFNARIVKGPDLSAINLSDENGNTVKVRATISNRTLTIRLSQMLKSKATYALTIPPNAVTDTREHGMEDEYVVVFSTKK